MTTAPRTTRQVLAAAGPALVGALAVLFASVGGGWPPRRSALGFMIGSWGARLTVQQLHARGLPILLPASSASLMSFALVFAVPAFFISRNVDEGFSTVEFIASAAWMIAFVGETTADRQWLRFASKPEHAGLPGRVGLWRHLPHAHAVFETAIWAAFALFASASPWSWIAWACPAALLYSHFTRRC